MQIFIAIAMMVASYLISAAMKPKQQHVNQKPTLEADIDFPQPEEGTPQGIIFGEAWITNWAVLWHGNYRAQPYQDHGTIIGYIYSFSMHMGLCRGPINEVVEIRVGDRVVYKPASDGSPVLTGNAGFYLDKPNLFGGIPTGSGGIKGYGQLWMGAPDQTLPPNIYQMSPDSKSFTIVPLANIMPGPLPAFRGVTSIFFDGQVSYGSPTPQAWQVRVKRHTAGWDGAVFYPEKAVILVNSGPVVVANPQLTDPNLTDDQKRQVSRTVTVIENIETMNPAHIVYEGITNRDWGRGLPASLINVASFRDAADQLHDEGFGAATKWDRTGTLGDFMQTIIDYMSATLYPDPQTGLLTLRLIRGDYDVNSIPTIDYNSGLIAITDNASNSGDTAANQVIVTYTSPVTGKKGQMRAQNLALITAQQGAIFSQSKTFDCIPNATIAGIVAERELKQYSSGLRRLTLKCDRSMWKMPPGGVLKLVNVPDNKIDGMVLRVGKVDHAGGIDGTVTLTCLQDVFAMDTTAYSYTIDTPPAWKPPVSSDTHLTPAPPMVSNLRAMRPWDGEQFIVTWDRGLDADHYDVQVVAGNPQKVVRFRGNIADNTFVYTFTDMLNDGGPWRNLIVQVRAVGTLSNPGPWFSVNLSNPQIPALTGVQITEAMKQAFFQCDRPAEGDWAGIQVYISDKQGFAPDSTTLIADGPMTFVTMTQLTDGTLLKSGTDYYLRAAGYDTFGKDSLNFSSEIVFQVQAVAPDLGTITNDMIAAGALDISKFARSIQPPVIVAGLPSKYAGSDVILNQADNKLYRWDGTQYVANVPASDIEGQLELNNIPQIPTSQLTGQISAQQIQANAIGANQIAAGAITAGKLAADSVTAGTVAAGAIGAREIAAGSISADKLLVGDMTNQVDDPGFSLGDMRSWLTGDTSNWSVDSTTPGLGADGGKGVLACQNLGGGARTSNVFNTRVMQVTKGDAWYAQVQIKENVTDANMKGLVLVTALDANKNTIETIAGNPINSTTYGVSSVTYVVNNPAVMYLQVIVSVQNSGGGLTTTKVYFDNVQMLRMSGVTLIQDGAISTNKLQAASITGDKIVANQITGDKLVANTITGDKIAANTITASLLAAGSVSADALQVGQAPNLITDPGFASTTQFWYSNGTVSFDGAWAVAGSNERALILQAIAANTDYYADCVATPVSAGLWYMASLYGINATTSSWLRFYFLNAAGAVLSYQSTPLLGGTAGTINGMPRVSLKVKAPVGAVKAVVGLGVNGPAGAGAIMYRPQLEECLPNQLSPSAWGSGLNTVIGPGSIRTGSLSAISANLGSITAGSLNINGRFIVDSAGNIFMTSGGGGQRTEINSSNYQCFDGNGVRRVLLGIW